MKSVCIRNYSDLYLPSFGEIQGILGIQSKFGKIPARITTNTGPFYEVKLTWNELMRFSEAGTHGCSVKKGTLEKFTKITGKHPHERLFFDKVEGVRH